MQKKGAMGKLTSIDELETRAERAQGAGSGEARPEPAQPQGTPSRPQVAAPQAQEQSAAAALDNAAAEEKFHGISENESLGAGHTALVVVAGIALVAVIAYFVNYWFHFV